MFALQSTRLARLAGVALGLVGASITFAEEQGSVRGRVVDPVGAGVPAATVEIPDLRRSTRTDPSGAFELAAVPPGEYVLQASSARAGSALTRVEVLPGQASEVTLALDRTVHSDEIVVSAGASARGGDELAQATSVLSGDELSLRSQATLGETLAAEPGLSSSYFGPGASRPIIRGLGGDRVRILQDGTDVGDAANASPDHAVATDPASAERIEVLRGPATLLYGSTAIGGVVNVISDAMPTALPVERVTGEVDLRLGSNADARSGSLHLTGRLGDVAWHAEGFGRDADDLEIPDDAFPEDQHEGEEEDHEEPRGILQNSSLESSGGAVGLAWIGDRLSVGVAARGFDTLYGVPGHGHAEGGEHEGESEHEEESVAIDLRQRRVDLRVALREPIGPFQAVKLTAGAVDYEHVELEGDEIGTVFENQSWDARIDASQRKRGRLSGDLGVQVSSRDFSAVGEEAFVAPTTTDRLAAFAVERVELGPVDLLIGGRWERQETLSADPALPDRDFDGVSGSVGALWGLEGGFAIAASVARSVKLPTAEELYSRGPHLATNAFEIGDPDLDREVSLGLDLALRRTAGRVRGELSLFRNRFDDYIYQRPTGEEEDGLPVFRFVQDDALFSGFELELHFDLLESEPHHLELELLYDQVRAELRADDQPLPLIPPRRYGAALLYRGDRLDGRVEVRRIADQDRVAPGETPTEGSTLVNAALGWRFFVGDTLHRLELRGTNLTDEVSRVHTSYLKDRVVLPGRDVSLVYRLAF